MRRLYPTENGSGPRVFLLGLNILTDSRRCDVQGRWRRVSRLGLRHYQGVFRGIAGREGQPYHPTTYGGSATVLTSYQSNMDMTAAAAVGNVST